MKIKSVRNLASIAFVLIWLISAAHSALAATAPVACTNASNLKGTLNANGTCAATTQTNAALNATFTMVEHQISTSQYCSYYPDEVIGLPYKLTGTSLLSGYILPAGIADNCNDYYNYALTIPTTDTVVVSCDLGPTNYAGGSATSYTNPPSGNSFTGPGTFYPVGSVCGYRSNGYDYNVIHGNLIFTLVLPVVSVPTIASASYSSPTVSVSGTNFTTTGNIATISGGVGGPWTVSNIASSNGTSLSFALPSGVTPGSYSIQIQSSNGVDSNSTALTIPAVAPSGLAAVLSTSGSVNLSWSMTNTTNVVSYSLERAIDSATTPTFSAIATIPVGTLSYADSLATANIQASKDSYRVRALYANGTYSAYSSVATASNCLSLSGSGPMKIVFMRGLASGLSVSDFVSQNNTAISQGFGTIDPYKTYMNKFSFYADFQKIDEANLARSVVNTDTTFTAAAATYAKSNSSCGSGALGYVFWNGDSTVYPAITVNNVSFIRSSIFNNLSLGTAGNIGFPDTVVHEMSHAIADLGDEYTNGGATYSGILKEENCTHDPANQYKNTADGITYAGLVPGDSNGSESFYTGCTVLSDGLGTLYRPSRASIMNSQSLYIPKFNVISCGYIVSAILGETVDKAHAQTHWSSCFKDMDTRKAEVSTTTAQVKVITVSGVMTSSNTPLFTWVDGSVSTGVPTARIPFGLRSMATNIKTLQDDINQYLSQGNKVLVIGHSAGSFVAYNVVQQFKAQGKAVDGVYIDPPYGYSFASNPLSKYMPGAAAGATLAGNIASDPNTVIWTGGKAWSHYLTHNPWASPQNLLPFNTRNLANLQTKINAVLATLQNGSAQATVSSISTSLVAPPSVSGGTGSAAPGQTVTLNGSGFDPISNTIFIQNTSNPDVYYTIYNVAPAGGSLSFVVPYSPDIPSNTVPGAYSVLVSGVDTDWSDAFSLTINAPTLSAAPTVNAAPATANPGDSVKVTGSGFAPTNNVVFTLVSPSSFNGGRSFAALFGFTPALAQAQTVATIYAYQLTGIASDGGTLNFTLPADLPAGTYNIQVGSDGQALSSVQSLSVSSVTVPVPTLQLSVVPSVVTSGQSASVSWTSTNAADCSIAMAGSPWQTGASGSAVSSGAIYSNTTFSGSCTGLGGTSAVQTATVSIAAAGGASTMAPSYSCLGGYTLSGTSCNKPATTVAASVSYSCASGSLVGTNCVTTASSITATVTRSCPSGYTLSGTNCNKPAVTTTIPASTIGASVSYSCSYGAPFYYGGAMMCRGQYTTSMYNANTTYSCPAGDTLSGTSCNVPASSVTTPASTVTATVAYSCPSAVYTLSGTSCNISASTVAAKATYSCSVGTVSGSNCNIPASTLAATASCLTGYTLSGSTCYSNTVAIAPSIKVISTTSKKITLSLSIGYNPGIANYVVSSGGKPLGTTATGLFVADNLSGTTRYCFTAYAFVNPSYVGDSSAEMCAVTTSGEPISVYAAANSDGSRITWQNDAIGDGVAIERSQVTGAGASMTYGEFIQIATTSSTAILYTDATSVIGSSYVYRLRAHYADGTYSKYSQMTTAITAVGGMAIATPKSLAATRSIQGQTKLSWNNNGAVGFTAISIERSLATTSAFAEIASIGSTTSYIDSGLLAGTSYAYRIRMRYPMYGYTAYSSTTSVTTLTPAKPALSLTATSSFAVQLAWTDADLGIDSFDVIDPAYKVLASVSSSTRSFLATGLAPSAQYCYMVRADVNPLNSGTSAQVCATTKALIAPSSLAGSAATQGQISLSWNNNSATGTLGVQVERSASSTSGYIQIATSTAATYVDRNLPPAASYWYRVRIAYANGFMSQYATTTAAVKTGTPAKPALSVAVTSTSTLTLSWTDSDAGVASFNISASPSLTVPATTTLAVVSSTTKTYASTNLLPSTKYCFVVQAYVNPIDAATSTAACASTAALVAPTGLTSSNATQGQVKLSWSDNGIASAPISIARFAGTPTGTSTFVSLATTSPAATSYVDAGLPAGTLYAYRIRFWYPQTGLYSLYAATSSATTLKPTAPALSATAASATGVKLSWTDNDAGISSFVISSSPDLTAINTVSSSTKTYAVSNLKPLTKYCYSLRAIVNPLVSATSTQACATTLSLGAPVSLTSSAPAQGQIKLSWSNNAVTGYDSISVERANAKNGPYGQIAPLAAASTTYADSGLPAGLTQYYSVRFNYGSLGYGPYAATTSATTLKPSIPSSVSTSATTATSTLVTWADNDAGISSYVVTEMSPASTTFAATTKSYAAQNLIPSTKYCFVVNAVVNPVNVSATSTQACATTKAAPAGAAAQAAPVSNQFAPSVTCRLANAAGGKKTLIISGTISGAVSPYALKAANGSHSWLFSPVSAGASFSNSLTLTSYDASASTTLTVTASDGQTANIICTSGSTSTEANAWSVIKEWF